ncbi:MAG TPA: RagB/SusD family nutrient uptake outer membrane protein [Gemmatimonadales bacterium]|nr:RagB/SusD family nutrient uptake outer membrane protein [Gemmatimonadales bacterium]
MIRSKTLRGVLGAAAVLVTSTACGDLEVTNPNNPGVDKVLATAGDVESLALGSWSSYWWTHTYMEGTMAMAVTADVLTANFGNFGMRFNNTEPRIPYDNNSAGGDRAVTEEQWDGMYSAVGAANDALYATIHLGIEQPTEDQAKSVEWISRLTQASVYSQLALIFDQAFIVNEDTVKTLSESPGTFDIALHPHGVVRDYAMSLWDDIIAETSTATWNVVQPDLVMGLHESSGSLTPAYLNKVANTMAARTLAYDARSGAETAAVDWNRVLNYATNGVTDITGAGPGIMLEYGPNWASYTNLYGNLLSWLRVDHRIINMMAPNIPATFTDHADPNSPDRQLGISDDARYGTDIKFIPATVGGVPQSYGAVIGDPLRGIYMMSTHYHARWENISFNVNTDVRNGNPIPFVLPAENNLLIAEALIRTGGDLGIAADLINLTRVDRGGLAPATAGDGAAQLLDYLLYERYIELMNTGSTEWLDARRFDDIQDGTWRSLPLPAKELETLGLPIYTFGGVGLPATKIGRPAYTATFLGGTPRLATPIR